VLMHLREAGWERERTFVKEFARHMPDEAKRLIIALSDWARAPTFQAI